MAIAAIPAACHARCMSRGARSLVRRLARRGRRWVAGASQGAEGPPSVTFSGKPPLPVEAGTTILEAALKADLTLDHFCGGNCSCGTCRVEVVQGDQFLSRPRPDESLVLGPVALDAGDRLACQAQVRGPVEVQVPRFFGVRSE